MMDAPSELMDPNQLALVMLEWYTKIQQAIELEALIGETILAMDKPKTVVTGLVRASYSGGRVTKRYPKALQNFKDNNPVGVGVVELIEKHTVTEEIPAHISVKTDYTGLVKAMLEGGFITDDDIPSTKSAPKVTLKIEKE